MKKLLLLFLAVAGMVTTAKAAGDLHLLSNLTNWSADDSNNEYLFSHSTDGTQDVYELTITSSMLSSLNGGDLYFRPNFYDSWGQRNPKSGNNETYNFTENGQWETKESGGGQSGAFVIPHSTIKASSYKITVYRKEGEGAWVKAEIISMPVTIGSTGMATFCCNRALNFDNTGINAFTITDATKATGLLTTASKTNVPANTGLYLEGPEGTHNVPVIETSNATAVGTNMLVGVTTNTNISQIDGSYTNYILTVNTVYGNVTTPKFYKVNGTSGNTVLAGKAYLQILTANATRESFWFDEEPTSINAVENAQMNGEAYNLAGQRVAQPTKGLYIVNGKKVIK